MCRIPAQAEQVETTNGAVLSLMVESFWQGAVKRGVSCSRLRAEPIARGKPTECEDHNANNNRERTVIGRGGLQYMVLMTQGGRASSSVARAMHCRVRIMLLQQ